MVLLVHVVDFLDQQLLKESVLASQVLDLVLETLRLLLGLTRVLGHLLLTLLLLLAEPGAGSLVSLTLVFVGAGDYRVLGWSRRPRAVWIGSLVGGE